MYMYSVSSKLILNLYSLQALKTCNTMLYIVVRAVLGNSQETFVMILVTLKLKNVLKNIFSKLNHGTVPEPTI